MENYDLERKKYGNAMISILAYKIFLSRLELGKSIIY